MRHGPAPRARDPVMDLAQGSYDTAPRRAARGVPFVRVMRALRSNRSPDRAVESLYRDYAADVYRYALAVLGSPADAEDVTQATFLNAFRAIERGESPRHPGAWLRAIAHNLCLQQFRQLARRPQQVELGDDAGELVADEQAPTLEDLIRGLKQVPFN